MAGSSQLGDEDEDGITGINVVPLVDIVLVLLIIFMVTTEFVQEELRNPLPPNVKIELPAAASGEETNPSLLSLVINQEGTLFLNGKESSLPLLKTHIGKLKEQGKKLEAVVAADRRLSHGTVIKVIDTLRVMGVANVAVNTRSQEIE